MESSLVFNSWSSLFKLWHARITNICTTSLKLFEILKYTYKSEIKLIFPFPIEVLEPNSNLGAYINWEKTVWLSNAPTTQFFIFMLGFLALGEFQKRIEQYQ